VVRKRRSFCSASSLLNHPHLSLSALLLLQRPIFRFLLTVSQNFSNQTVDVSLQNDQREERLKVRRPETIDACRKMMESRKKQEQSKVANANEIQTRGQVGAERRR